MWKKQRKGRCFERWFKRWNRFIKSILGSLCLRHRRKPPSYCAADTWRGNRQPGLEWDMHGLAAKERASPTAPFRWLTDHNVYQMKPGQQNGLLQLHERPMSSERKAGGQSESQHHCNVMFQHLFALVLVWSEVAVMFFIRLMHTMLVRLQERCIRYQRDVSALLEVS